MSMSSKDYESIAKVITAEYASIPESSRIWYIHHGTIKRIVISLSDAFAKDNPRFLPHVFLTQCNLRLER